MEKSLISIDIDSANNTLEDSSGSKEKIIVR